MYPCYDDYLLVGPSLEYDYDYADDGEYDVYLFWPTSSQVLVPADVQYAEDVSYRLHFDTSRSCLHLLILPCSSSLYRH